jgi:hypothetical protein
MDPFFVEVRAAENGSSIVRLAEGGGSVADIWDGA